MPGKLGIVVGLAAEARLARKLGGMVAMGGGSRTGAVAAAESLARSGVRGLISFGLAGGLDPALLAGTILVPAFVRAEGHDWPVDPALAAKLGGFSGGRICDSAGVVATCADKQQLHAATGAVAVDLESGAVAHAAAQHGIGFAVLRAICDPADRALPPAALVALNSSGAIGLLRVTASVLGRPAQLPALLALARDAATARRALLARVRAIGRLQPG